MVKKFVSLNLNEFTKGTSEFTNKNILGQSMVDISNDMYLPP
jgi:hypothetical protein